MEKKIKVRELLGKEFIKELDPNLVSFCREIRKDLRDERI